MITIAIRDKSGAVRRQACAAEDVHLVYAEPYQDGDEIEIAADEPGFFSVKVDAALDAAAVYLPAGRMTYPVPDAETRRMLPPAAFTGKIHLITAKRDDAPNVRRNVAYNPADRRGDTEYFPHAYANVETRGEAVFAARNVIDGLHVNDCHGEWPYHSWGIGAREDAWIMIDFGRAVTVDAMALYLRADFPHDAYWTQATVRLSDGFEKTFPLQKSADRQEIALGVHTIRWIRLERLIKSNDPSAFPALSEWEVYGIDAKE